MVPGHDVRVVRGAEWTVLYQDPAKCKRGVVRVRLGFPARLLSECLRGGDVCVQCGVCALCVVVSGVLCVSVG